LRRKRPPFVVGVGDGNVNWPLLRLPSISSSPNLYKCTPMGRRRCRGTK
jgi:hypothetical protein